MAVPTTPGGPLRPLLTTLTILALVAAMYLARVVVVPVVLAALLSFLLTPLAGLFQRLRLPRVAAALLATLLAFGFFAGMLAIVVWQFQGLAKELPTHRAEVLKKAQAVRWIFSSDSSQNLTNLIDETVRTISPTTRPPAPEPGEALPPEGAPPAVSSTTSNFWGPLMEWAFAPALEVFVDAGVVMVLVVFMVAQREDLRDRLVRLSGTHNVTKTTKSLGDAAHRVRRYLLHQFFINCAFGLVVSVGLWFVGVPYPWLWGVFGAALRYVPYIGTWLAAVCPVLLSIAISPGWTQPLEAFGLFVLLDLVITNALEPIVYGKSVGVSGTALLIAAVFWTWLWGPIGLILATPLTAVVVVLGRQVPALEWLSVLLGDRPALSPPLALYQRLVGRDEDEASSLIEEYVRKNGVDRAYDHVLAPALVHLKENAEQGVLTPEDEEYVLGAMRRMLEDVVFPEQDAVDARKVAAGGEDTKCRLLVLGVPAKDEVDETGLTMLQRLLPAGKCQVELLSKDALAGEVLTRVAEVKPAVVVIGAVPPYSFSAIRYLCKRLRAHHPNVKILVGCWGLRDDGKATVDRLKGAGADLASAELLETRDLLLPLIQEASVRRAAEERRPAEAVHA
jgi:predicted PurR-regulated permease PerM